MNTADEKTTAIVTDDPFMDENSCESGCFDGNVNQALQSYLQELGRLPRMTQEEQTELGHRINEAEIQWRDLLYQMAYTVQWQLDYLNHKRLRSWTEIFMPSSVENLEDVTDLQAWKENLSILLRQLEMAFLNNDTDLCNELRVQLRGELFKYKFSSDILMQCYDQLLLAVSNLPDFSLPILAEESCCSPETFRSLLDQAAVARKKLLDLRQQMVEGNLRLVIRIVNQYSYRHLSVSDLVQEGNLGLMRSLEKFDFNLKHKFSTYASWWIRQSIGRAIAEQFRVIRIPAHMLSTIAAINRVEQRFILEHDRLPENEEIASLLEMPSARISAIRKMARQTISLQSPLTTDASGSSLEDVLPDERASDPSQDVSDETISRQLKKMLSNLTERERTIVTMRFGLMGERVRTLQEISDYFNISRERVRQLEMQTLNKLRTPENLRIFGSHQL